MFFSFKITSARGRSRRRVYTVRTRYGRGKKYCRPSNLFFFICHCVTDDSLEIAYAHYFQGAAIVYLNTTYIYNIRLNFSSNYY